MRKFCIFCILIAASGFASAEDITAKWKQLHSHYLESVTTGHYADALNAAQELNSIDPANSESLLFIVYASIKSGKNPPQWVLEETWPTATSRDRFNRQLAEDLMHGR